jgi:isopenicillin N synthase-like dioxygenase
MHRVVEPPSTSINPNAEIPSRYSIAFFGHYNLSTLVKPLDALVSDSAPAKFEPVEAGEHVKARVRQLHLAGHSLKAIHGGGQNGQTGSVVSATA